MYEVKQFEAKRGSGGHKDKWIFIRISRAEAAGLIRSLSSQLEKGDPNTGRVEAQWTDKNKDDGPVARGFISIAVQDPLRCFFCGDKIKPFSGVDYKGQLICQECSKKVCEYCRQMEHAKWCSSPDNKRRK